MALSRTTGLPRLSFQLFTVVERRVAAPFFFSQPNMLITMKSKNTPQLLSLLVASVALATTASAQFVTGFEDAQGYSGTTLNGVDDPMLDGDAAWYIPATYSGAGSRQTYLGSPALRISDSNTSAWAFGINAANAIDYTQPFKFSFDLAVASMTAGTATGSSAALNIRLGADTNSNSNKSWARISYNVDDSLSLWINSGGGTTTQMHVGNLADFVTAGTYLSVSITVDPSAKTYTGLTLSGDKKSETIAAVAGVVLPWIPNSAGDPPANLWFGTTGQPTSTSYIDNISLTNIPEPSAAAVLLGFGGLAAAGLRRRRSS